MAQKAEQRQSVLSQEHVVDHESFTDWRLTAAPPHGALSRPQHYRKSNSKEDHVRDHAGDSHLLSTRKDR